MTDLDKEPLNEISSYMSDLIKLRGKLRASITKLEDLLSRKKIELSAQKKKIKDIQRLIDSEQNK